MSEQETIKVNDGQKQCNISPDMIVNAYIHQIEKLLNPQLYQTIPIDIYQLCADFYIVLKLLFIKYSSSKGEAKIGVINTKKQCIVNQIILNLPKDHYIENGSLCFIPNISKYLINLNLDIIKSMNMDFQSTSYNGFFCFLWKKKMTSHQNHASHQMKYSIPCLIFYNAANNSYDIEAKILISNQEILDLDNKIDVNTAFCDVSPRIICQSKLVENELYQLKLAKMRTNYFEFEPMFENPPFIGHTFIEQTEVEYEEVLDVLLNGNCCVGVYDENAKRWRPGVYMDHWDKTRRIMIRFVNNPIDTISKQKNATKIKTIQYFPAKNVWIDEDKFMITANDLYASSHLSEDSINKWIQHNEKRKLPLKKFWIQPPTSNIAEMDELEWIKYYFLLRLIKHRHSSNDKNLICIHFIGRMPLIYDHELNTAFLTHSKEMESQLLVQDDETKKVVWFDENLLFCAQLSIRRNCVYFYFLDTEKGEYEWTSLYQIDITLIDTLFD